jgi:HK97 family phage portal protein
MKIFDAVRTTFASWIAPATRTMPQQVADALVNRSSSGVAVTESSILTASAVFAALRVIAETVGQLEWEVYERIGETNKPRYDHPLRLLLDAEPNPEMTASAWRHAMLTSYYLWGNMIAEIVRVAGRPRELWPIHPSRVHAKRGNGGKLYYEISDEHGMNPRAIEAADVFHVPLLAGDGIVGKGFIQRARDSVGLTLGIEEYSGSNFRNGSRPGGLLRHPGRLTKDARENIRAEWDALHRGADKAGRIAVLQEGMDFTAMQINAVDSQLIEQRTFQLGEVARWFSVPPHLLRDLSRATFGNIEHQGIEYRTFTIQPLAHSMQQEAHRKLLMKAEKATFFTELDLDDLDVADMKSRYDAYAVGRQNGWLNANEIRAEEGLNPIDGDAGSVYLVNGNMIPAATAGVSKTPDPAIPGDTGNVVDAAIAEATAVRNEQVKHAFGDIIAGEIGRLLTKESNAAKRAANKPGEFIAWLDSFYAEHRTTLLDAIGPTVRAFGIATGTELSAAEIVDRHIESSRSALLEVSGNSTAVSLPASVEELVSRWDNRRATEFAREVIA